MDDLGTLFFPEVLVIGGNGILDMARAAKYGYAGVVAVIFESKSDLEMGHKMVCCE